MSPSLFTPTRLYHLLSYTLLFLSSNLVHLFTYLMVISIILLFGFLWCGIVALKKAIAQCKPNAVVAAICASGDQSYDWVKLLLFCFLYVFSIFLVCCLLLFTFYITQLSKKFKWTKQLKKVIAFPLTTKYVMSHHCHRTIQFLKRMTLSKCKHLFYVGLGYTKFVWN